MLAQIRHWLAAPIFTDDREKTQRARLFDGLLVSGIPLVLAVMLGGWITNTAHLAATGIGILAIGLLALCRYWVSKGWIDLVATAIILCGLVIITADIALLGTIRAPVTATYIVLILVAGLAFDDRRILVVGGLCSLAVAGLIAAELAGWLPKPDYGVTPLQWITWTALFLWIGT